MGEGGGNFIIIIQFLYVNSRKISPAEKSGGPGPPAPPPLLDATCLKRVIWTVHKIKSLFASESLIKQGIWTSCKLCAELPKFTLNGELVRTDVGHFCRNGRILKFEAKLYNPFFYTYFKKSILMKHAGIRSSSLYFWEWRAWLMMDACSIEALT